MKLLRETVRKILLQEYACEGINKTLWSGMLELERQGFHILSYYRPEEYDSGVAESIGLLVVDDFTGKQKATWLGEYQVTGEHCLGAFQCTNTHSGNLRGTGVGALLYDVACELTGEKGLSSDRNEVSNSAWKMWKYMTLNDQTYDIKGSYDYDGEQTPEDPMDDCMGISWEQHVDHWKNPNNHPLNHVFVKKDKTRPTIACLEERGLIKYED
mgnify:CR=1 FL=1